MASSDEEIVTPRRRRLSSSKKRQLLADSGDDSSEIDDKCCIKQDTPSRGRSSERIRKRQSQEFRMPDKHEYWNKIPNCHTTAESVKSLTPKKLVSNFTKVYNSYNADTYDTDEEEMSEFIVEDDEIDDENSTSDETDDEVEKHTGRIDRNRTEFSESKLHRVREISSSDSEPEVKQYDSIVNKNEDLSCLQKSKDNIINNMGNDANTSGIKRRKSNNKISSSSDEEKDESVDHKKDAENVKPESESDSEDDIHNISSCKKKRKVMSSDSESDTENKTSRSRRMSATTRTTERLKQRQELFKELKESRRKSS